MRKEVIGSATLYCGDCRDVLPTLGTVDAVVTDPPYGVNLTGKIWHSTNRGKTVKSADTYASYEDTAENFDRIVVPALKAAIDKASCAAVFIAEESIWKLPPGTGLGGVFSAAGTGLTSWGFQCFMHVVFYGKCPYLAARKGSRPNGKNGIYGNDANKIDHPCAKPIAAMEWAVQRASLPSHVVLDPFMGSGTTGVACSNLDRPFVGIELDPGYFDTACRRIEAAQRQAQRRLMPFPIGRLSRAAIAPWASPS